MSLTRQDLVETFICSIEKNNLDKTKQLLSAGFSVNSFLTSRTQLWDSNSFSVLAIAAFSGSANIVDFLIKRHVNINQVDKSKRRTALHWAVASGNLDISLRLIQAGAIVNSSDRELITPLMVASNEGHLSLVRMLIDHGADVNQTDRINYTALHYACIKRHNHIVYELLSAGAALPSSSWTICHPLKLLVVSESYALAKTLIESGSYHLNVEKWVATGNESKNKWFLDWLREYSKRPRSLKSLCRANTRARLGGVHLAHKVQLLDVPKHVQNFLLMK